jgi:hypothetical protein
LATSFLSAPQCDPPLEVTDLFVDIQDGKILMALLEVLSGQNLVRMSQRHQKERKREGLMAVSFLYNGVNFCHCDKILEVNDLKEERFILVHTFRGCSPWLLGCVA